MKAPQGYVLLKLTVLLLFQMIWTSCRAQSAYYSWGEWTPLSEENVVYL
jgi:hypothetical protein